MKEETLTTESTQKRLNPSLSLPNFKNRYISHFNDNNNITLNYNYETLRQEKSNILNDNLDNLNQIKKNYNKLFIIFQWKIKI